MPLSARARRVWRITLISVAAVIVALAAWALIEPWFIGVDRVTFSHPDIPAQFDGAKVVFVADVHAGPYFSRARVARLVDKIQAQDPDLIILGGDYVGGRRNGAAAFYPEAKRLSAPLGVVAVLGNHDHWEGDEAARTALRDAGIILIENDNVRTRQDGSTIRIAGVDDAWVGEPDAELAADAIAREEFAIFVSHTPDYLPTALPATKGAFDLALSGHTHGGQGTLFGLWAPVVPSKYGQRFRGGWTTEAGIPVLVTRGVGMTTLPVRFFAPPQIHVITLKNGPIGISR